MLTCPSWVLPSGAQILARPSADDDNKDWGESIQETLETAAACATHPKVKADDGTANLYALSLAAAIGAPSFVSLRAHELE